MGSIGPAEILVVLVVALIVLGPNRLPDAARSVGRAVSELRRMTAGVQAEMRDAFAEAPPSYPKPPPPTTADAADPADPAAADDADDATEPPPGHVLPSSPGQAELAAADPERPSAS